MSQENVELVYRALDAFNRRDLDAALALMHGDVEFGSRLAAMEGGFNGHEGIRRWWQTILDASPDRTIEIVEVRDLGDVTLTLVQARGHGAVSHVPYEETVWSVAQWRGKKAVWWRVFPTEAEALEATGLRESAMSQENVDLARRNFELVSQGADDEVARRLAPNVEWHHNIGLGTPMEGIYHGREEVLALFRTLRESFGRLRFDLEEVRDLPSREVLSLGYLHADGRGSGAAATTPFGAVTEIRDGLTVRHRFWMDREAGLEAAGLRE